jgi:hypothetical protein
MMSLQRAYIGCRVIETAENYVRADTPLREKRQERLQEWSGGFDDDGRFWETVIADPEAAWGKVFWMDEVAVSEWVARVPGLYWRPEAALFRELSPAAVEHRTATWVTYRPLAKSQRVLMGGIGTLRLPPAQDGYRLVTLTTTCNVSAGVPALVSPEVWEHHRLQEGAVLAGRARWCPMARGWWSHFESARHLPPRGYLILEGADAVQLYDADRRVPTLIHPFTVMEYYQGAVELFDYVYAAADTGESGYRGRLERFFDGYKDRHERYGRYLLSGDMVNPLWDARFAAPEDLRRADPTAGSQLRVLEARVRESHLGQDATESLLEALSTVCETSDDVKLLSDEAGIPPNVWFGGGTVAEVCNQLVALAVDRDKVAALIEVVAAHYRELFQA